MLLFIISEIMVFGAFFTAYFFIRVVSGDAWPAEGDVLPKAVAGVNTAILLSSSITLHWTVEATKRGNRGAMKAGIATTFLLGLTFLFIQVNEYVHVGFSPSESAQASIFYGLTGLHGAHVFIGLLLLVMVASACSRGHFSPESHRGLEVPGIYWHFVDVMWVDRLLDGLPAVINPLRSEREAFQFLVGVLRGRAAIVLLVLLGRAVF